MLGTAATLVPRLVPRSGDLGEGLWQSCWSQVVPPAGSNLRSRLRSPVLSLVWASRARWPVTVGVIDVGAVPSRLQFVPRSAPRPVTAAAVTTALECRECTCPTAALSGLTEAGITQRPPNATLREWTRDE